jgi:hypothetical protein
VAGLRAVAMKEEMKASSETRARVARRICMGTIVVCAVLLIFGVGITLYHEDGWMLLLVAIALATAFIFVAVS